MEIFQLDSADLPHSTIPSSADQPDKTFTITKLTPGVKNPQRVNVFVDEKFAFSLNLAEIVDFKIKVGQKISSAEFEKFDRLSEFGKLYQTTLEWILLRPRSERETYEYLFRKQIRREIAWRRFEEHCKKLRIDEAYRAKVKAWRSRAKQKDFSERSPFPRRPAPRFSNDDARQIIQKLFAKNLLDDRKFAEYYIENRRAKQGISAKKLRQELLKKGVDAKIITEILSETSRADTVEIKKLITKKRAKYDDQKLLAYLMRQGFDYETARSTIAEFPQTSNDIENF